MRRIASAAAVTACLATSSCSFFQGLESATTDTTRPKAASTTTKTLVPPSEPSNTPKTLPGGFPAPVSLEGVRVKLTEIGKIEEPTAFTTRPGYPNYYLTERIGHVRQLTVDLQYDRDGKLIHKGLYIERGYVLDLAREVSTDGERGMYGIAYSTDGRTMFVSYTDKDGRFRVSSWRVYDYSVDPSTRKDILTIDHPRTDHIGGTLVMGPDGFLYVGTGDAGGQGDPDGSAKDPKNLLGKILRIDPEGASGDAGYAVPDSNPFKDGQAGAPEVWALGVSNPKHFSFDKITKDLWVPDVAGTDVEEITFLPIDGYGVAGKGANLGWNVMNGSKPLAGGTPPAEAVPPLFEYPHAAGECGVVGGYLYRGIAILPIAGAYVYGDFCTGEIRGLIANNGRVLDQRGLGISVPPRTLAGFGETDDGELWVLTFDGTISRLDPA